jgi:hypothetical protein
MTTSALLSELDRLPRRDLVEILGRVAQRLALVDPAEVDAVPREALADVVTRAAAIQARAMARLASPATEIAMTEDKLLTLDEAAEALRKSPSWLYHHARKLPFTRRVGRGLRFSSRGLRRYLDSTRPQGE